MSNNSVPNLNNFNLNNGSSRDIFNAINKCYKKDVVNKVTRGGVNKRIFKPNIPIKTDRTKEEDQKQEEQDNKQNNDNNKNRKDKFNKTEFDRRKGKNFIQLEGTFESFKSDAKARYVNGFAGGGGSSSSGYQSNASSTIKNEQNDKRIKTEDELKREKKLEFRRATKDEDYLSDELEENDFELDDNDMPISWTNYNKMLNKLNNLNKEEEHNVNECLDNGRLILMPCIFGNKTGDTGYKLQVLKSGKMRLVDKKSGFIVDLLNTGNLENDAIKEVVELNDDKLLRYGSLKNMDIYSPVRNLNSDYNSILQE